LKNIGMEMLFDEEEGYKKGKKWSYGTKLAQT
jgi:hypothetical protein